MARYITISVIAALAMTLSLRAQDKQSLHLTHQVEEPSMLQSLLVVQTPFNSTAQALNALQKSSITSVEYVESIQELIDAALQLLASNRIAEMELLLKKARQTSENILQCQEGMHTAYISLLQHTTLSQQRTPAKSTRK